VEAMTKARWNEKDLAYYNAQRQLMTELAKAPNKPVEFTIGRSYTFIVAGEAEPGGSKQAFVPLHPTTKEPYRRNGGGIVVSVVDANKNAEHWKKHVAKVARNEYSGPVFTDFLRVTWIFYQPRPQFHYTSTGKLSKAGIETPWPNVKPDATKLVRAAEDALRSICYSDDAIIVKQIAEKEYGSPARMEVTIEELLVPEPYEQPVLFEAPAPWEVAT
jgi:Holliday junction resolvase RusA-like endonuclease